MPWPVARSSVVEMSFVHCPSCHRAYDLRRAASCPACQRSEAARPAVVAAPAVVTAPAPAPVEDVSDAILVEAPARAESDLGERIAAMVEELAALVDRASTAELETARHQLDRRGLRALWGAPAAGGSRLLAAGEWLVAGAMDVARRVSGDAAKRSASEDAAKPVANSGSEPPRQGARRLVRRLRDVWAGSPRA